MTPSDFLRFAVWAWLLAGASHTQAQALADLAVVQAQVRAFVQQQLVAQFGPEKAAEDIEWSLGNLDARLRLAACDAAPQMALMRTPLVAGPAQVKVQCQAPVRWAFTVPVQVTVYGRVAVAARQLARGQQLQAADVRWQRYNLAQLGPNAVDSLTPWQGYELKRPVAAGEPLRSVYFAMPYVIRTGDPISLQAEAAGFSINTLATALTDGQLGSSIRVKNNQTQRILTATVVAPGVVRVQTLPVSFNKNS